MDSLPAELPGKPSAIWNQIKIFEGSKQYFYFLQKFSESPTFFFFFCPKTMDFLICTYVIFFFFFFFKSFLKVKFTQSCPTLCDPMDYIVHGILHTKILEWVALPFSRGSSQPRDQTQVSCIAGRFLTSWATREAQVIYECAIKLKLNIEPPGVLSISSKN